MNTRSLSSSAVSLLFQSLLYEMIHLCEHIQIYGSYNRPQIKMNQRNDEGYKTAKLKQRSESYRNAVGSWISV